MASADDPDPRWERLDRTHMNYCIQCGRCTSSCPLATQIEYSPRQKVNEERLLEMRGRIVGALIWENALLGTSAFTVILFVLISKRLVPATTENAEGILSSVASSIMIVKIRLFVLYFSIL